jgi:hypothetical protein
MTECSDWCKPVKLYLWECSRNLGPRSLYSCLPKIMTRLLYTVLPEVDEFSGE